MSIGGPVRIEGGTIEKDTLYPLVCGISMARANGALVCRRGETVKELLFSGGRVVGSRTQGPTDDWIGRLLLSWGVITPEVAKKMEERADRSLRYGEHLMALRALDRTTLEVALRRQLLSRIEDVFNWADGSYLFSPGEVEAQLQPLTYSEVFGTAIRGELGESRLGHAAAMLLDTVPVPANGATFESVAYEDPELNELLDRVTGRIPFRGIQDPFSSMRFWQNVLVLRKLGCIDFPMPEFAPEEEIITLEQSPQLTATTVELAGLGGSDARQITEMAKVAFHQAKVYLRKRQFTEAELAFFKASVLSPDSGDVLGHLAWTRVLQSPDDPRNLAACRALLQQAVTLAPESADVAFFLAGTLRFLGEHEIALAEFERVLTLNPAHPEASLIVKNLKKSV